MSGNEDTTPKAQKELETLNDGMELEVTFEDATTETVKVRKIPMREMSRLGAAWAKEPKELLLYVRRNGGEKEPDDAWIDRLNETSWETLIKEGRRINFSRFTNYFARQREAFALMGNDLLKSDKLLEKAVEMANAER